MRVCFGILFLLTFNLSYFDILNDIFLSKVLPLKIAKDFVYIEKNGES